MHTVTEPIYCGHLLLTHPGLKKLDHECISKSALSLFALIPSKKNTPFFFFFFFKAAASSSGVRLVTFPSGHSHSLCPEHHSFSICHFCHCKETCQGRQMKAWFCKLNSMGRFRSDNIFSMYIFQILMQGTHKDNKGIYMVFNSWYFRGEYSNKIQDSGASGVSIPALSFPTAILGLSVY